MPLEAVITEGTAGGPSLKLSAGTPRMKFRRMGSLRTVASHCVESDSSICISCYLYVNSPTREGTTLDLLLANGEGHIGCQRRDPEDWRIASIVRLFKKGKRHNSGNYRPISL
eukprot:g43280.t1